MKVKNLFLSSIILGGFVTPLMQVTTADAITINTEVKAKKSQKSSKVQNNQEQRETKLKLGEKVDLADLNTQTSIVVPATTKNTQNKLDDIYVNLDDTQIKDLQENKEVEFDVSDLDTQSTWGGKLNYKSAVPTMKLVFDETSQSLTLVNLETSEKSDHLIYNLVNGEALVHYRYKDTNEEIYAGTHEDAYKDGDTNFYVFPLARFDDAPAPVGHFDAMKIDFDNLDPEHPEDPLNPDFDEQAIEIDYNIDDINRDNTEYTVYLEKAKPITINFIVYLDDKVYDKKTITGEVNTTIPVQDNEKLPDKSVAHLDISKTKLTSSFEYFPQLGETTIKGKAFHKSAFDYGLPAPREKDFLNKTIYYSTQDNFSEAPVNIDISLTGNHRTMELFYESNTIDKGKEVTADVTIKTNLGDKIVSDVTGKVGDTIDVKVPEVEGYTADKKTVKATVTNKGEIITTEEVTYTKNSDGNDNNNDTGNGNNSGDGNDNNNNGSGNGNNSGDGNDNNNNGSGNGNNSGDGNDNNNNGSGNGNNSGDGNDNNNNGSGNGNNSGDGNDNNNNGSGNGNNAGDGNDNNNNGSGNGNNSGDGNDNNNNGSGNGNNSGDGNGNGNNTGDGNDNNNNGSGNGNNSGDGNDNNNNGSGNGNNSGDGNGNNNNGSGNGNNAGNGNDNNNNGSGNGNNNNGSGTVKPPVTTTPQPEKFDGFVGTMHKSVSVYNLKDGKMGLDKHKELSENSDWKSDRIITIDGVKYYRVATNEWAKASDIYRYESKQGIVDTKNAEITYLVRSNLSKVGNRGLSPNTSWKYDRIAYLGDKETVHYRVATREFINANDVIAK